MSAGGVIRLTCGGIGTGKSYLNVKNAEEAKKSGKYKYIYSNIRSHSELADGITLLPDDWRDCESDSLIIIDEIQMHEKFSKHFSSRRDSEIAQISMIRHKRLDIWMISPNPALVNSDIRNLVNQYVWLEIVNKKVTKGWCFLKVHNNVTKTLKNTSYEEFTYVIEEKYYKLYKSTEDGKASGRNAVINYRLIGFISGMALIVVIAMFLIYFLMKSNKAKYDEIVETDSKQEQISINPISPSIPQLIPSDQVDFECRKAENVDLPQCKEWYNNFSKQVTPDANLVKYDPSKPFDLDVTDAMYYEVTSKPKFSGCVKFDGKYHAYTEQGTYLNVSSKDCQRLINDAANRPYDYFKESYTPGNYESYVNNSSNNKSLDEIAKFQQAKEEGLI